MATKNQGFIQVIIIIVLLVIILSLLGVSLSSLFSNPLLKDNFEILWDWVAKIWNNYLSVPFVTIWQAFKAIIWQPLIGGFQRKP